MSQRFRLKASFDISGFSPQTRVILTALKKYGMFVADNGSSWYLSGEPNAGWNDDVLVDELRDGERHRLRGDRRVIAQVSPDSGQVKPTARGQQAGDPRRRQPGPAGAL